jgi:hypothetical protein
MTFEPCADLFVDELRVVLHPRLVHATAADGSVDRDVDLGDHREAIFALEQRRRSARQRRTQPLFTAPRDVVRPASALGLPARGLVLRF